MCIYSPNSLPHFFPVMTIRFPLAVSEARDYGITFLKNISSNSNYLVNFVEEMYLIHCEMVFGQFPAHDGRRDGRYDAFPHPRLLEHHFCSSPEVRRVLQAQDLFFRPGRTSCSFAFGPESVSVPEIFRSFCIYISIQLLFEI